MSPRLAVRIIVDNIITRICTEAVYNTGVNAIVICTENWQGSLTSLEMTLRTLLRVQYLDASYFKWLNPRQWS